MRMETLLTHELGWFEHFNHRDTARIPFLLLASWCLVLNALFSLLYNEWFVTKRSWSSVAGVLIGTSVSAS